MPDTASPRGAVVYLHDHRRTEPEAVSVGDAIALCWASFWTMWLASVEVAKAMQRETLLEVRPQPCPLRHASG